MASAGFLAIGSGPAGVSAAETFRSKHRNIAVGILSDDPALPYAKPPLSKQFLCGEPTELELHSAGWFERNDIELSLGVRVAHIDTATQQVITTGGARYRYWHLVLAVGSTAVPLAVPGGESALTLRSFADAVALKMAARHAATAVVVGGGLIGCEAASCLAALGVDTTLVAPETVPLQRRFGVDVGERVVKMLSEAGCISSAPRRSPRSRTRGHAGQWGSPRRRARRRGDRRPPRRPAGRRGRVGHPRGARRRRRAHADLGPQRLRRGDITIAHNVAAGRPVIAEHWRDAALQGRVAGLTAAGFDSSWDRVPGFSCVVGGFTLTYRGWGGRHDACTVTERANGFRAHYSLQGRAIGTLDATANPAS